MASFFLQWATGKPLLMTVMTVNQPNTTALPAAKMNPKKFLFFNEVNTATTPNIATSPKTTINIMSKPPFRNEYLIPNNIPRE
jgi:hypothetical protein